MVVDGEWRTVRGQYRMVNCFLMDLYRQSSVDFSNGDDFLHVAQSFQKGDLYIGLVHSSASRTDVMSMVKKLATWDKDLVIFGWHKLLVCLNATGSNNMDLCIWQKDIVWKVSKGTLTFPFLDQI